MTEHTECPISCMAWLTVIFIIFGGSFQAAHVKSGYQIPFKALETTFNQTTLTCLTKECSSQNAKKLGFTLFWTLTAMAEPLGAIPAFLTGRNLAERLGRKSVMFLALPPICAGLAIQGLTAKFLSSIFIPLGRLFHAFGTTWLVIGGITFASDLLKPALNLRQVTYIFCLSQSGMLILVQLLTLPQVLGTADLWPWLNAVSAAMLIPLTLVMTIVPEAPGYLYTIGAMEKMHQSLDFYNYSKVMSVEMFMNQMSVEKLSNDWDKNQSFSALKVVKRQRSRQQMDCIYVVIYCSIVQCLLMSNVIYMFLGAALQEGMGLNNVQLANVEVISAFGFGFLASLVGLKLENLAKMRTFLYCTLSLAVFCYVVFAVLGFLHHYLPFLSEYLNHAMYLGLLILFPSFNLGLVSLPEDIALDWLIPAAQGPTMAIAMATGKLSDLVASGGFYPIFQYGDLGIAWSCILLPLLLFLPLLMGKLPKEKRTLGSSHPQIPLAIYPEMARSQLTPPSSPGRMTLNEDVFQLQKSNSFTLGDEKIHASRLKTLKKRADPRSRSHSHSPDSRPRRRLERKLQHHSRSNYLQKQFTIVSQVGQGGTLPLKKTLTSPCPPSVIPHYL